MRSVNLAYGAGHRTLEVPDDTVVIEPRWIPSLADPVSALRAALAPLAAIARPNMRTAIAFPDNTRPMPNHVVLPVLLEELERLGIMPCDIVLCCATGTHAQVSPHTMAQLVGEQVSSRYRIHQHDAVRSRHRDVGVVDGTNVLLDAEWVDAELRLATGFVEPHFFAGFSGGPKAVCPGLAGLETILEAHSSARIADPHATWLELDDNPVHQFVAAATALCPPTLSIDVELGSDKRLAALHVGALPVSHRDACAAVRASSVELVDAPFDLVVSTNSGLPLDRNLYQAVKGMAAAERCVRAGGAILMAASCLDGIPTPSPFAEALIRSSSPADLARPGSGPAVELWQTQVLGRVLERATVHLFAEGLSEEEVRSAHCRAVDDLQSGFDALVGHLGPGSRIGVLPRGPLSVVDVSS